VLSLEDALKLVVNRARLMETLPSGGMLAVPVSEGRIRDILGSDISIAAINAPSMCVVSGRAEQMEKAAAMLAAHGIESRQVHVSVAAHSEVVDSILADARSPRTQSTLNLKVKFRESFRPFAPAVLREDVADWFDLDTDSPYMLLVAEVAARRRIALSAADEALLGIDKLKAARSTIPAVTHVDFSARVQTVDSETNPRFHRLLSTFKRLTGCPVVVNTSFNVRGEPPVLTPEDAFHCFMGTEIDVLAFGQCYLRKEGQKAVAKTEHRAAFVLD
jgi:carbamoyltransferase